jgi:hypothetical protein
MFGNKYGDGAMCDACVSFRTIVLNCVQDGFDIDVTNIQCQNFKIGSYDMTLTPSYGAVVTLDDITISCSGDWKFKLHSWPHIPDGSGSANVSISGTNANVGVLVTEKASLPVLAADKVSLNIGSIDITFHGSLWDWLLDLLKDLLSGSIKSAVSDAFDSAITKFVNVDANAQLAKLKFEVPLKLKAPYNIAEARFGLVADPDFNTSFVGVALQGDVVPIANPVTPPITPPQLPAFDSAAAASYIQMHFSDYTFVSAVYTFYQANLLTWPLSADKIPLGFNETVAYVLIAPGFPLKYPTSPVSLFIHVLDIPTFEIQPSGITVSVPVGFDFNVPDTNGNIVTAFTLGANTSLGLDLSIGPDSDNELALLGNLSFLTADLYVIQTNVGSVSTGLLQDLINFLFTDILLPIVNDLLVNGIPLPSLDVVILKKTALTLGNENIMISSDFVFNLTAPLMVPSAPKAAAAFGAAPLVPMAFK